MIINNIINRIKESNRITITFHVSPDGDSLGSSLALMLCLKKMNKNVSIVSKDSVPESYKFLPGVNEIEVASGLIPDDTDCLIILDCGDVRRVSADMNINSRNYTLINIDHHLSNDLYGDLNYVDTNAAAVGEIVYQLMQLMGISIDKDIATCLYTSIVTDTGGFKHSNTTSVTHTIIGDIINSGIDFSDLHRLIFENKKLERVKLYGKVIDKMVIVHNGKVCIMQLSKAMLDELNLESSDTSDIVSIGMSIDSVEVGILLKETVDGVKISLRSKSKVDVRKIAETFGGGGHTRASGLSTDKDIDAALEIILKAVEKELV